LAQSPAPFVNIQSDTPGAVDFSQDQFTPIDSDASKKADAIFSLVTKNPSSLPLNLQLALAQLQMGNLKGASATLDRILTLYPNDPQVQLLMAQTENRLGNVVDASNFYREVISNSAATAMQKEAASAELGALLEDAKVWKYSGLLQAGIGRSMNPLNSSKYLTVLGFDLSNPSYASNYATTFMYFGSVSFERSLENQANDSVVVTLSRFNQQYQNSDPTINYGLANLGINTGTLAYQSGAITDRFTLAWNSSQTTLSNKGFMNSNWASSSYQKALGENLLVNGGINYGYNNQLEGVSYSGSNSRSNWMSGYTLNGKYFLDTNWVAEVNLARYNYAAQTSYESYFMNYELASLAYLTKVGVFSGFVSNVNNQYKDVDPISGLQRQIQTAGFGGSYTVSLPNFTRPERKDLTLSLNYQQSHGNSNVQTYNTQSRQYMAILSKGF
jgi:tetratricopeptide (TPR) repeat protein